MPRRLIGAVLAAATALALASVATAENRGARVFRATLAKTAAADTAQLPGVRARAQLVDGKKNNKVSIGVRGLQVGVTYPWHVHKAKNSTDDPCAPGSPAADPVPFGDWKYRALTGNADGNGSSKGTSVAFNTRTDPGPFYVNVHLPDGTVIACGVLKRVKKAQDKPSGKRDSSPPRKSEQGKEHGRGPKPGKGPGAR